MTSADIRARADECLGHFKFLLEIETQVRDSRKGPASSNDEPQIDDQRARFKIWAGNIGVFADGHASLDYRLRDNENARNLMKSFLGSLIDFLRRATDALRQGSIQDERISQAPKGLLPDDTARAGPESVSSAISSSFQGSETDSMPDFTLQTPLDKRLQGVERSIDRLYRLSRLIRQPSIARQNSKAEKFEIMDEEGNNIDEAFASFALEFVKHRFPEAPELLVRRLAKGITVRRKRFLYRQSHQRKLSATSTVISSAALDSASHKDSTVRGVRRLVESLPQGSDIIRNGRPATRLLSQTSASALTKRQSLVEQFVEDEASRQSTVFTKSSTVEGPMQVPEPPKPTPGSKEFECPYCCIFLPISQAKASRWRRHVLDDLEPYTCVFEKCAEPDNLFRDQRSWVLHMQKAHTSRWVCTSTVHHPCTFEHEQEYEQHMWTAHKGTFTASQLRLLTKRSKLASAMFEQCPLCGYQPLQNEIQHRISSADPAMARQEDARLVSDRIAKHLASHLEALSVKSLPWHDMFEDPKKESTISRDSRHVEEGTRLDGSEFSVVGGDEMSHLSVAEVEILQDNVRSSDTDNAKIADLPNVSYEEEWGFIPRSVYHGHDRDPTLQTLLRKLYLETSTSPNHRHGPILPTYFVPVDRDKNFTGRKLVLKAIDDFFSSSADATSGSSKPMSFPRCFTIYGPGGLGKTYVAAQFAIMHRENFNAILWVHAENASKIAQDFKDIAVALGLVPEDSVDASDLSFTRDVVIQWLVNPLKCMGNPDAHSQEKASWLLVFDGVEDPDVLNSFWPYNGPGCILITSRNPQSWSNSLQLLPFSPDESTAYLKHVTRRSVNEEERLIVNAIANRSGGLPLVLAQMGSFIEHKAMSFTQFLHSYEEKEGQQRLLQWSVSDARLQRSTRERNIASVWALDSLAHSADLLNTLSILDPDGIPEFLFTHDTNNPQSAEARSNEEYKRARDELLARSLVTGNKREKKLFIHRVVQEVARAQMRQSELRVAFFSAVHLVFARWPFELLTWRNRIARWGDCEELFTHVQRLKDLYPEITPSADSLDDSYAFAKLLVDAGWYLHERGRSADASLLNNMGQSICASLKLRLIEDTEFLSASSVTFERLNYTLNEDALTYLKLFNDKMLKEFNLTPRTNDMRLAISWNELGNAYMLNHNLKKGEESFVKSIEEMEKVNNFDVTFISLPLVNLGLAYWMQEKLDEAAKTLLKGLQDREAAFGVDDRTSYVTGRFLHALGNVRNSQGAFDEALDYHRRALLFYKSTLGNHHHRTADVLVKVADHNIRLHQYDMALALIDYALDAYSQSNNFISEKARASFRRIKTLRALQRVDEADSQLRHCFEIYTRLFKDQVRANRASKSDHKTRAEDLDDSDFDSLIVFWSR